MIRSKDWVEKTFGRFAWENDSERPGAIKVLGEWERQNIVSLAPPFALRDSRGRPLSVIRCHRLIAPALTRALSELKRRNLCQLINTFDGCYVPRHMSWNLKRPLSRHSWGIAIDLNARLFPLGSKEKQNARLIEIFAKQGFTWGGEWKTPDPMHFEIVDLAQPAREMQILLDGELLTTGVLHDGKTLAPVREIAQALGARVEARMTTGVVKIFTPDYEP